MAVEVVKNTSIIGTGPAVLVHDKDGNIIAVFLSEEKKEAKKKADDVRLILDGTPDMYDAADAVERLLGVQSYEFIDA